MKNILLVQFRQDSSSIHEQKCFLRYFKKKKDWQLKFINAFDEKVNFSHPQKMLKKISGVILGGSGEFYFSGNSSEKEKIFKKMLKRITPFVQYLIKNDFPTLGICFGHQILGYFLGKKVVADKNQAETGSFLVFLNQDEKKSFLFSDIPNKFFAQFGHRDSLDGLPPLAKLLAKTKKCKVAAFQYKTKIFGVQFHPELTLSDMLFRFKLYPQYLGKNLQKIKKRLKPSPYASRVILNFLKLCKLNNKKSF